MKTPRTLKESPALDLEQQKQAIAYQLWEDEGRPEGKAEAHWEQACLVVMTVGETELPASPVWLKRQDDAVIEPPTVVEHLNKRTAARHAA